MTVEVVGLGVVVEVVVVVIVVVTGVLISP